MKIEKPVEAKRRALHTDQSVESDFTRQSPGTQLTSFPFDSAVIRPTWAESYLTYVQSDQFPVSGPTAARWLDSVPILERANQIGKQKIVEALAKGSDDVPGYQYAAGAHVREVYSVPVSRIWQVIKRALAIDESVRFSLSDLLAVSRLNLGEAVERFAVVNGISPKEAAEILDRILNGLIPIRVNKPSISKLTSEAALLQAERIREKEEQP
jgi:hypothetical protein